MLHPPPTKTEVDEAYNETVARLMLHDAMQPGFKRWERDTMAAHLLLMLGHLEDYIAQKRRDEEERIEELSMQRAANE